MTARAIRLGLLGLKAVAVSSVLASLVMLAVLLVVEAMAGGGGWDVLLSYVLPMMILVSAPCIALGLLVFGFPVDWLLGKLEARTVFAYGVAGTAAGFLLGCALGYDDAVAPAGPTALVGAGYGFVSAVVARSFFRAGPADDD